MFFKFRAKIGIRDFCDYYVVQLMKQHRRLHLHQPCAPVNIIIIQFCRNVSWQILRFLPPLVLDFFFNFSGQSLTFTWLPIVCKKMRIKIEQMVAYLLKLFDFVRLILPILSSTIFFHKLRSRLLSCSSQLFRRSLCPKLPANNQINSLWNEPNNYQNGLRSCDPIC